MIKKQIHRTFVASLLLFVLAQILFAKAYHTHDSLRVSHHYVADSVVDEDGDECPICVFTLMPCDELASDFIFLHNYIANVYVESYVNHYFRSFGNSLLLRAPPVLTIGDFC